MSVKQFISAEEHLAKLGVTVQQAQDFIFENVDNPELLFTAARQNGVTNGMLSEITNFSTNAIGNYFVSAGIDSKELDKSSILFNSDLGSLENLVDFNDNAGILSNNSLKEQVISSVNASIPTDIFINFFFSEVRPYQSRDGLYDSEELGVGHLDNVPATNDNIESLFFGTLINMLLTIDETELSDIRMLQENVSLEDYQAHLADALSDSTETPVWTDEELAGFVTNWATTIIELFDKDVSFVGTLDPALVPASFTL
jgi:hypothetical protein